MYFKAVFDLNRPIETKVTEEKAILSKMEGNPLFINAPTPYPMFRAALELQDLRLQEAEFGGIDKTSALRTQEQIVDLMVVGYREYVTIVAQGDKDIILSAGFRHTKERTPVAGMGKVEGVKSKLTGISGELALRWKPIKGKQFYEVEVQAMEAVPPRPTDPTTPPPVGEVLRQEWKMTATSAASIVLKGLRPFTRYMVRIRAKGAPGYGEYSDTIEIVVL